MIVFCFTGICTMSLYGLCTCEPNVTCTYQHRLRKSNKPWIHSDEDRTARNKFDISAFKDKARKKSRIVSSEPLAISTYVSTLIHGCPWLSWCTATAGRPQTAPQHQSCWTHQSSTRYQTDKSLSSNDPSSAQNNYALQWDCYMYWVTVKGISQQAKRSLVSEQKA